MSLPARIPRVAFLTDSFHEVNGVAHTSRHLDAFARRQGLPLYSVHAGQLDQREQEGSVIRRELVRGRTSFSLDRDLRCDPLLWHQFQTLVAELREFGAEVIHITGPGDFGVLGLILARHLHLPLVASWHTNLHDYAGRRLGKLLPFLSDDARTAIGARAESWSLWATAQFYRQADVTLAPNQELINLLTERTGRPCLLMQRGVDTKLFQPARRTRSGGPLVIGYVGRLTVEKNVPLLVDLDRYLHQQGIHDFRFLIVGQGAERDWLAEQLPQAEIPGVLRGEPLAEAYANMDLFVFPSTTDTFGNVVLEALASGVPAVVTAGGGPKFLVEHGETGLISDSQEAFLQAVASLLREPERLHRMSVQGRAAACRASWDRVFENVYSAYDLALQRAPGRLQTAS